MRFFGRIFSSQNLARIFSSGSQNLQKITGKFLAPLEVSRYSHMPCLLVNPIPIRRHPGAWKLHAADARNLRRLRENHRWVLLRGTFFPQVADQSAFLGRTFFSENLARTFSSGSQNIQKIPGTFLALFALFRSLTPALPACQSYSTQAISRCWGIARS